MEKRDADGDVWVCRIGGVRGLLPRGADLPMRQAVAKAFRDLFGREPDAIFSGWGNEFSEAERAVIEDRLPDHGHGGK